MIKIAIASGKGGTGKTFVSTHLYHMMTISGMKVGVVDCDAEVPNSALFLGGQPLQSWPVEVFCPAIQKDRCTNCGLCSEVCFCHAITCLPALHYINVMPDLCHACTACREVCPEGAILSQTKQVGTVTAYGDGNRLFLLEAKLKEGQHSPVSVIREVISRAKDTDWDYMIMDAPPGCACPFVNTVKDADKVILVTEPTPFGLSDLQHTVQVLRHLQKDFSVVINRSDLGDGNMKAYLYAEKIPLLAEFPFSEKVAEAYSRGILAADADPAIRESFECLMNNVLKDEIGSR